MHLFMLLLLALSAEGYERIGDKHAVTVYKRNGHAIDLAAEANIDATPEVVQKVLTDYPSHVKWVHGLSESRVLVHTDCSLDVYQRLDLPLVGDRDFTLRVEWGSDGGDRFIRFHGVDSGPPPAKGVVRIPLHEGSWVDLYSKRRWLRAKLIWASTKGTLFMFVSHGGQPHSMTRRSCERLLRERLLRPLGMHGVVAHAIDALHREKPVRDSQLQPLAA
jgi:hypothetical protein